ncbi:hypothetical protein LCGC14_2091200 [marine sediment metagenome]|uniref:Uncharacterized protein n=1 Tax=marine sediment metagenome TaxID=412755 RepID=A0A0F9ECM7_9ZZZZ
MQKLKSKYTLLYELFIYLAIKRKLQTIFLESLACETPVIASYVGGISEILSETNLIQSGLSFFISDIRGIKQRYYCLV